MLKGKEDKNGTKYTSDGTDCKTVYYDFYGKLFKTVNDEKEIEYVYEYVGYSDNLSRVTRIIDPYEEKLYE